MKKILYILFYSAWGLLTLLALPFYFFALWLREKVTGKEDDYPFTPDYDYA